MDLWSWPFVWKILPILAEALWITIEVTIISFIIALILGLMLAIMRRSKIRLISWPTAGYVEAVRSTPALIQLYFLYFALPQYGIMMSAMLTGIICLGNHFACYCSEVYRAGLDGVPRGQIEAAESLSLSSFRMYKDVIIPQSLPPMVPAMGNYLIVLFKLTPILAAIAVVEVMRQALNIGSHHFRYIEPITIVGIFFLILSLISAVGIHYIERWMYHRILE